MARYNLNDRPFPSGSMDPRLNPDIVDTRLNAKLGPPLPNPLVRQTRDSPVRVGSNEARRRLLDIPERFNKD